MRLSALEPLDINLFLWKPLNINMYEIDQSCNNQISINILYKGYINKYYVYLLTYLISIQKFIILLDNSIGMVIIAMATTKIRL